jgi:peptide/nickel transport system substrate-binding protein
MRKITAVFIAVLISGTLTACNARQTTTPLVNISVEESPQDGMAAATQIPTPTSEPPRVLTICLGQEPASLFLYGDTTAANRSVLQAIYDGPLDMVDFAIQPVILERMPTLENGDASLHPVEVAPGELLLDTQGNWVSLQEGVSYYPSGCDNDDCARVFEGQDAVEIDALSLQFHLLPGIQWSDGAALTAADSVYSFKVLQDLFEATPPEVIRYTRSYTALDDLTVEWVGIPGYRGSFETKFFHPLPEHLWGGIPVDELLTAEITTRAPVGWGPYVLDEWTAGDHITLSRNPNYFRAKEGLPHFDYLVYRFVDNSAEAIDALLVGECDFIDRTVFLENEIPRLLDEQAAGSLRFDIQAGIAWELAAFGIGTLDSQRPDFFAQKEVRQAIAMCVDRQAIVENLFFGLAAVPDSYVPPAHPLYNPDVRKYAYNPDEGMTLLNSAGWIDHDLDSDTPRISAGVPGLPDGTSLEFTYLIPNDGERLEVAKSIQAGLEQCGVGVEVIPMEWDSLMMPGPEGPLFGRQFAMAQLAWQASFEPACFLFLSEEIPGPYPDFPKGWGGANLSGYSNPDFDRLCGQAMSALPGSEIYLNAHAQAQMMFAEDLPVIPLYQHIRLIAMRPELCGIVMDPAGSSALSHLELLDYGESCSK